MGITGMLKRLWKKQENTKKTRQRNRICVEQLEPRMLLDAVTAHWVGGSGNWSDGANWDIGIAPNDNNGTGNTYTAVIDVIDEEIIIDVTENTALSGLVNSESIRANAEGVLTISGTVTNTGDLRAAGGILSFNSASVGNAGGLITEDGGTLQLADSTIKGGTLAATSGIAPISISGTLDGVTVEADLVVEGSSLTITNGMTLNGTLTLADNPDGGMIVCMLAATSSDGGWGSSSINFVGDQALSGTGELIFANTYSNDVYVDGELTIEEEISIHSAQGDWTYMGWYGESIVNNGSIKADGQGITVFMEVDSVVNHGKMEVNNGGTLSLANLHNTGTITSGDASLILSGILSNEGVIAADNTLIELGCTFALNDLGAFHYDESNVIFFTGTLDNTGKTLTADTDLAGWILSPYGTIKGGTLFATPGTAPISISGTLDGVTVEADLVVERSTLTITNGIALNGTLTLADNPNGGVVAEMMALTLSFDDWSTSSIDFAGSQILSGTGKLIFENPNGNKVCVDGELTIGESISILGYYDGRFCNYTGNDNCNLIINGSVEVYNNAVVEFNTDTVTFNGSSRITSQPTGAIYVAGDLTGSTANADRYTLSGTTILNGQHTADKPQYLEVMSRDLGMDAGGFKRNFSYGTLSLDDGSYVKLIDQSDNTAGAESEALYVDSLTVPSGATLDLNGFHLYARACQIDGAIAGGQVVLLPDGGSLTFGNATPGAISEVGEIDEWSFYGRAGRGISAFVNTGNTAPSPISPYLGYAEIRLLDADSNILAVSRSTGLGQVVNFSGINLPSDGIYRIQVCAPADYAASTGNYLITVWDVTVDTAPVVVNQQRTGAIETPYNVDRWTFYASANQQVKFDLMNTSAPGIVFDLAGPDGWTAFSGISMDSDLITLPASGVYTLAAYGIDEQYGGSYVFTLNETVQTTLSPGVVYEGVLEGSGQAQLFKIDLTESSPLQLLLDDVSNGNHTELYVKSGAAPTRGNYDYRAADSSSADQKLLIPMAAAGTYYVLVYGNSIPLPGNYTLLATASDVIVDSVSPDHAGNAVDTIMTFTGIGFSNGMTVELVSADGTHYAAGNIVASSKTQMSATFAAGDVSAGIYSVRVADPSGDSYQLTNAFRMKNGGEAQLETHLIVPSNVGRHATATLYIEYANTGTAAMAAPLLVLGSGDPDGSDMPLLTLDQSLLTQGLWTSAMPAGFSTSIQILATGATPGVLQPGESFRVPVYYAGLLQNEYHSWDFFDTQVEFNLGVLTDENTATVDWSILKDSMRPASLNDAAWNAVWNNFISQTGTTWGDYVTMLDDNATYLGRLGERVLDVGQLLAFELEQAEGMGPVKVLASSTDASVEAPGISLTFARFFAGDLSSRYETGTLGYGWSTNWDYSATTATDGTVTVSGPGGSLRTFKPDSRTPGAYFSGTGDYGKLSTVGDGKFVLTETDGSRYAFRADGKLAYVQDTNSNRITCGYTDGLLTSLTHSAGQSIQISYNAAGRIKTIVDSTGRETTYTYDSADAYLHSVTEFDGRVTAYTYDTTAGSQTEHALTLITRPGDTHQYFSYDAEGRMASIALDGDAEKVSYGYDNAGTVYVTNALEATSTLFYDYRGLLLKTENALGNAVYSTYDGKYNLTAITNATGHSALYSYDAVGNLIRSTDAMGHATNFTYTSKYNKLATLTDANGNITRYGYDNCGNLSSITYANGSVERWDYNSNGTPADWVNCRGSEVNYTYDSDGRITTKTYADGTISSFTYDSHGNLLTATDVDGAETAFTYNDRDELTRVDYPGGQYLIFTYDDAGRRTSSTDQLGHEVNYSYDAAGRLATVTDETGSLIAGYTYDAAGQLTGKDLGNGVYTTYDYDAVGQLLHLVNHNADGSVLSRFDYTYDRLGLRTSMATVDGIWAYTYDDIGQLTHAVFTANDPSATPNQNLQYLYDAMGNRIKTIENGVTTDYTVNNMNQYTKVGDTAYVFDADGNLIQEISPSGTTTYTYSAENRLTAINAPQGMWQYRYDAQGNRVSAVENGVVTNYVIDPAGLGNLVGIYDATGNLMTHYAYASGLLFGTTGFDTSYFTFDALGSTSELTTADGGLVSSYLYDPFGKVFQQTGTAINPFQFVSEQGVMVDGAGLNYMRTRQYSPEYGRFVTADHINITGGLNLYAYSVNNPVIYRDALGTEITKDYSPGQAQKSLNKIIDYEREKGTLLALLDFNPTVTFLTPTTKDYQGGLVLNLNERYVTSDLGNIDMDWAITLAAHSATTGVSPLALYFPAKTAWSIIDYNDTGTTHWNYYNMPEVRAQIVAVLINEIGIENTFKLLNIRESGIANSSDPNQLTGPAGYGDAGYISADTSAFSYRIDFENDATATAPAQQVKITNQLNENLDWNTFELTEIGFGDTILSIPAGSSHYETTVSMTYNSQTFDVQIEAGIDYASGQVYAVFQSLDPNTGLPPEVLTGFLPPEDGTGRGMGHVSYLINPKAGLTTGTQIRNIALIQFDGGEIIATNQVNPHDPSRGTDPAKEALNTIDAGTPDSNVLALSDITIGENVTVQWSGLDDENGSGIANYDIYVSTDGGDFALWQDGTSATSATFTGLAGHTYAFYSVAKDHVGHVESAPVNPDASTLVIAANTAPVATGDTFAVNEDTALTISTSGLLANDTDAEGDALTLVLLDGPAHGSLTLDDEGSFIYTPNANWNGVDSFTYKANDGSLESNVATVAITVNAVNDAPVLGSIGNATVTEGQTLTFMATASDVDNDALSYSLIGGPTGAAIDASTGVFTWTPEEGQGYGVYNMTVNVTDNGAAELNDSRTFSVTVLEDSNIVAADFARDGVADTFMVTRDGNNAEVFWNGTIVFSQALDILSTLTITGSSDSETLIVDTTNGNPIPAAGLIFTGNDGTDNIITRGAVATVTHTFAGSTAGSISLDSRLISYTGTETLTDNLAAANRYLVYGSAADNVTITIGETQTSVTSTTNPALTLTNPADGGWLTLMTGNGSDVINLINSRTTTPDFNVVLDAGAGSNKVYDRSSYAITRITGTENADTIRLNQTTQSTIVTVNSSTNTLYGANRVELIGLGGDDKISLYGSVTQLLVDGGDGNDTISAAGFRGNLTALGGGGNDNITGSPLNDVLIGGTGDDTITGGAGDDLIAAGGETGDSVDGGTGTNNIISFTDEIQYRQDLMGAIINQQSFWLKEFLRGDKTDPNDHIRISLG